MIDTNQLPPLPTLQPGDSHMESLIEAAIQGHADTREAMRWLVRQIVPATQSAEVTDEQAALARSLLPVLSKERIARVFGRLEDGLCKYEERMAREIEQAAVARTIAILALRPVQVPMTDEQADALATEAFGEYMCDLNDDIEIALVRKVEAHHGITAQAKKE